MTQVGVEGTGSYGAGLARHLRAERVRVLEVDRPDRKTRRAKGKSDPIDAYAAARAVLSGAAGGMPKAGDGRVEAIRALRVARRGAVKARTQAMNQLKALIVTGPVELRRARAGRPAASRAARPAARRRVRPRARPQATPARASSRASSRARETPAGSSEYVRSSCHCMI